MKRAILMLLAFATLASAQGEPHYLKCFRDEGGVLHEVQQHMPDTPPTIPIPPPPPTTTTTLPSFSFNYTPQLHWRLLCPNGVYWGPWGADVSRCSAQRAWLLATCPKKRVDKTDGFLSVDAIRLFRAGCGTDNGVSCNCVPEYY